MAIPVPPGEQQGGCSQRDGAWHLKRPGLGVRKQLQGYGLRKMAGCRARLCEPIFFFLPSPAHPQRQPFYDRMISVSLNTTCLTAVILGLLEHESYDARS